MCFMLHMCDMLMYWTGEMVMSTFLFEEIFKWVHTFTEKVQTRLQLQYPNV